MSKANLPVKLSAIQTRLAKAETIAEAKEIRDHVATAIDLAKRRRVGTLEEMLDAQEGLLDSDRRLGEMLAGMEKQAPGEYHQRSHGATVTPTLASLEITKSQSSRWQKAAAIPEAAYREWVKAIRKAGKFLTQGGLLKLSQRLTRTPAEPMEGVYEDLQELIQQEKRFGCVYADPPWQYDNRATRASAEGEYSTTMTVEEICAEPVAELTTEAAHLHLWTTNAFLFEAKRVLDAWGFQYKSCFVWVKPQMGIGNYWRVSHEFLLLGVKGDARSFARHDLKSWAELDRTQHSKKPRWVRETLETVSPGPYLELYARQRTPNWTVYGNQIPGQQQFPISVH